MAKRKRAINGVMRRYSWRLYPTPEQAVVLQAQAIDCASLWNALLEICETRYRGAIQRDGRAISFHCDRCAALSQESNKITLCSRHKLPSEYDMGAWIKPLRAALPEWHAMSSCTPQRICGALAQAFATFFSRVRRGETPGYPRYKSSRRNLSIPHRCYNPLIRPTGAGCQIRKADSRDIKSNRYADEGGRHSTRWMLRLKGIPMEIAARGDVPAHVNEWNDADVKFRDGNWEISIAMAIDKRRHSRGELIPITVSFDLVDDFVRVNGVPETPTEFFFIQLLDRQKRDMKSRFDLKWPRGKRHSPEAWSERQEEAAEISRLSSRIARIRANTLHVWSKRIVERASELTVIVPAVKENTRSPRGTAREWGAEVKLVNDLNRTALSYAPAMAAAMLEYKAKELGVWRESIRDKAPKIAAGGDLVAATRMVRRAKRILKDKEKNEKDKEKNEPSPTS